MLKEGVFEEGAVTYQGTLSGGERTEGNISEVTPDRYQVSQN